MWRDDCNPAFEVEKDLYCSSNSHRLIGTEDAPGRVSLHNIGEQGENLTIAILSMNRSSLTKRLMNSIADQIPDFKGIFMIFDNGSEPEELKKLRRFAEFVPFRCQFEPQEVNYGVAGGRNRIMKAAKTDWVFCLDNDMVFMGNPFPQAQQDIARLGVHFLSVPFINSHDTKCGVLGGNLFMENIEGRVNANMGTALLAPEFHINEPTPGFLCTGIFGGASIINRHTFEKLGGYDDNMFVGFEDIEFSMRVFQAGYKVGSMATVCISHDHEAAQNTTDHDYEKEWFHKKRLYDSAMHFEKKHGIGVWNRSSEDWIDTRREELNIEAKDKKMKKRSRVALIIDKPDWALDHIAEQVVRYCSDEFEFRRYYSQDVDNLANLLIGAQDCDVIHFFWRGLINWYYDSYAQDRIKAFGYTDAEFREKYLSSKLVTTSVYDHLYLKDGEDELTAKLFSAKDSIVDAYTVSSQKLKDIYDRRTGLRMRPAALITDGVDLGRFKPANLERFRDVSHRTIRFGWVGNSNWNWADADLKGVHTIIKPAIEALQKQGYDIELITSDRDQKMIPHAMMPRYYEQIDCYLCASLHEGTPNPVLEAMACGIPVISTDVGLIPQLFGEKQKQCVLKKRTKEDMIQKIKYLVDHPKMFTELSQENLQSIQAWDWSICARRFADFWKKQMKLKKHKNDSKKNVP